jgi:hypothetical protein
VDFGSAHRGTAAVLDSANDGARLTDATAAIERIDSEIRRLTTAIAGGGDLDLRVTALRERQEARAALLGDMERFGQAGLAPIGRTAVERQLRARLDEWRGLLGGQIAWTRQILAKLLDGRITMRPIIGKRSGSPAFRVQIPLTLRRCSRG